MSGKLKKTDKYSNYVEHLLVFVSTVTGYVSISVFESLVCVTVGNASSGVRIKSCAITAGTNNYEPLIKKKKKIMIK